MRKVFVEGKLIAPTGGNNSPNGKWIKEAGNWGWIGTGSVPKSQLPANVFLGFSKNGSGFVPEFGPKPKNAGQLEEQTLGKRDVFFSKIKMSHALQA